MARDIHRGEIWMHTFAPPDKRRPVLVLSREQLLRLNLHEVVVAPITSTRRGVPVEVECGVEEGLKGPSAISLLHVRVVERADLRQFIGALSPVKMREVCIALNHAMGCD